MFHVSILCKQKLISPHMHYLCTNKRHTKGNNSELAPDPYVSTVNVHLVDINVFAKFDEIPSLPVPSY